MAHVIGLGSSCGIHILEKRALKAPTGGSYPDYFRIAAPSSSATPRAVVDEAAVPVPNDGVAGSNEESVSLFVGLDVKWSVVPRRVDFDDVSTVGPIEVDGADKTLRSADGDLTHRFRQVVRLEDLREQGLGVGVRRRVARSILQQELADQRCAPPAAFGHDDVHGNLVGERQATSSKCVVVDAGHVALVDRMSAAASQVLVRVTAQIEERASGCRQREPIDHCDMAAAAFASDDAAKTGPVVVSANNEHLNAVVVAISIELLKPCGSP